MIATVEKAAVWFEERAKNTPMPGARGMFEIAAAALHEKANGETVQQWIFASELPEEHDSIWAKLYGTKSWQPDLFRKCSYDVIACVEKKDGSRRVISIRTYDGKWDHNKLNEEIVVCWQPMPQPPKGE